MAGNNLIVGLSGCSSSGKTTLARLLRDIFPSTFILHEDDFYKAETELPSKDGLLDWDCPESISIPSMEKALVHIRENGTFPCPVSDDKIAAMKAKVEAWLQPGKRGHAIFTEGKLNVCLFDGFLLYCKEMETTMELIDIKLFLLVSRAKATQRREARDGYVTLEGFWQDPPGYVDNIVWPNYVDSHSWLFENGNVEGKLDADVLSEKNIKAQVGKGLDIDMETTLEWTVDTIITELEKRASEKS
ncbi:nicotinamide riboside kinase 1 [Colletotrichum salicis]|uniref:Nicotinamide riboside kinase 1 n=1 Tax=Colletotrichum salicis TaxID=1209931 RepID=A0A135SCW7_9PEZI|nr:nicotinamide riboside kinase 1 [Colletotrichum salicis]